MPGFFLRMLEHVSPAFVSQLHAPSPLLSEPGPSRGAHLPPLLSLVLAHGPALRKPCLHLPGPVCSLTTLEKE